MAYSVLIKNGTIIDGTGKAPFAADIGILDNKIKEIGNLQNEKADQIIDATNLYVSPGFIDITNHADTYGTLFSQPAQQSMLMQGVTTILGGNCGESLSPVTSKDSLRALERWSSEPFSVNWSGFEEYQNNLQKLGPGLNAASLVGHWTLKRNSKSLEEMVFLLEKSMADGAWGLSSNFSFSSQEDLETEMISLLSVVKKYDGIYKIHLQDEGKNFLPAIVRVLNLARKTGARTVISHFKAIGRSAWRDFNKAILIIKGAKDEGVDISFDVFPYLRTGSMLSSLLPEWVREKPAEEILKQLNDKNFFDKAVDGLKLLTLHPERILIASSPNEKSLVGKSLEEIVQKTGLGPEEVMLQILMANNFNVTIFGKTINGRNMISAVKDSNAIIASDGAGYDVSVKNSGNLVHPRSFGAFARFFHSIAPAARLSPEAAIAKMTSLPAKALGLKNRGVLKLGHIADIAVFHPEEFRDTATYKNPFNFAAGMKFLLVFGRTVISNGEFVSLKAGRVLRKSEKYE